MREDRSGMRSRGLDEQLREQRSGTLTFGELKWQNKKDVQEEDRLCRACFGDKQGLW